MGYKVKDRFRTNYLSFEPGGVSVLVEYKDGRRFEYDKIKNPQKYIQVVLKHPSVKSAWVKK